MLPQQKKSLVRGNKMFCHELKHVLLRLENETNDVPCASSSSSSVEDVDEDWYSESEDYLDDEKYTSTTLGSGGPQASALARSESLLRSIRFSQRNRVVAPKRCVEHKVVLFGVSVDFSDVVVLDSVVFILTLFFYFDLFDVCC
jgi:hypothetical protein